jgi:hypothetical protein
MICSTNVRDEIHLVRKFYSEKVKGWNQVGDLAIGGRIV